METITCVLQKRSLEAVKISCDKRMRWGLMIAAKLVGNTEMDYGSGGCGEVWRLPRDALAMIGCLVFLGGERMRTPVGTDNERWTRIWQDGHRCVLRTLDGEMPGRDLGQQKQESYEGYVSCPMSR